MPIKHYYKKTSLFFIALLSFNLVACSNKRPTIDTSNKEYSFETAQKYGDVIQKNDTVYNIEKLDTFIKKYNSNKSHAIRITRFNEKDEPLIIDLTVKKEGKRHLCIMMLITQKQATEIQKTKKINIPIVVAKKFQRKFHQQQ